MTEISAKRVAELRELTGLGMMACKKALVDAEGDLKKAEEILRIKSGDKVSKLAGRTAAEGAAAVFISDNKKVGALVEVNCETDFVARDAGFIAFAHQVAQTVAHTGTTAISDLANTEATAEGETVESLRKTIAARLGENISIRRAAFYRTEGYLASYLHGSKIGVIVDLSGGDDTLGKEIAMHIAASHPTYVSKDQVPSELIEQERKIYNAQAAEFGKTGELVTKMVEGRINKYLASVSLLSQPFVKNPDQTVENLLIQKQAKVNQFTRFVVGEGIEKKQVDFAAEVAAVTKG